MEYDKKLDRKVISRLLLLLAELLALICAVIYLTRFSPGFHTNGEGRYYISSETGKPASGIVTVSRRTRLLDPNSIVSKTYLLDENGYTQTGFVEYEGQTFYLADDGTVTRGICTVDGKRYCFDADQGAMLRSTFYTLPDSDPEEIYYFGADGVSVTGLLEVGEAFYFFSDAGVMQRGITVLNGKKVYFGADGRMVLGFVSLPEGTYYFGKGGAGAVGFQNIGADLYYFDPETSLMKTGFLAFEPEDPPMLFGDDGTRGSGVTQYAGELYFTDPYGIPVTGWINDGGNVLWCDAEGKMAVGLTEIEGKTYFFDHGILQTGWKAVGDGVYFFFDDGHMAKGVCLIRDRLYRFENDGRFFNGFVTVEDWKYYYDDYGFPVTGLREINGYLYFFEEDGRMRTDEWLETVGGWMYFRADGVACTGEKKIDGKKYYFGADRFAYTGFQKLDGFTYYFDGRNGALTGTHTIDGTEYTFAENGILASEIADGRNGKETP